jgi:hypothetical protein
MPGVPDPARLHVEDPREVGFDPQADVQADGFLGEVAHRDVLT